jgi:hypothetical protein
MSERRNEAKREGRSGHTLALWNVDYISAEQNIESIGYFSATYSRRSITDNRASKVVTLSDTRTIEILPSKKYGLPNAEDLDFYRAFLKICHERVRLIKGEREGHVVYHPELPVPIGFSSRELTVKANKKWSGRAHKAVREWIERLNSTTIHGAIFSAKEQKYDVRIGLEPLFRQYVHVGHPMIDGQLAPQNLVWPAQWFLDNYYYLYTRPLDLKFHHRLTCSIAKALYPLLDAGWFASGGSPYTKRYTDLCALLDIQVYKQLSRVQQQLGQSHGELVRENFLASYDYPIGENGQWTGTVRWWPGPKWLHDQENRGKRKQLSDGRLLLPGPLGIPSSSDLKGMSPQLDLPLRSQRATEEPELYGHRVKQFYAGVGQARVSLTKIQAGTEVLRRLVEQDGFSLHDIDFALEWVVNNLDARFGGAVKSLGLLPHVIGEALKDKERSERKRERDRMRQCKEQEEQRRDAQLHLLAKELDCLPLEEQAQLRREAIKSLTEQGFQRPFLMETLIKQEMVRLRDQRAALF